MASDPASVTLADVKAAMLTIGVDLGDDFVSMMLMDDVLRIERVDRSASGIPRKTGDGGVGTATSEIPVAAPPAG